jgi:hypothetical protein
VPSLRSYIVGEGGDGGFTTVNDVESGCPVLLSVLPVPVPNL